MTIKLKPGVGPRVLRDGTTIFPRFSYTTEQRDVAPRIRVTLEVEIDDWGCATCVGLSDVKSLDGEPITGETLRAVPIARLLRLATGEAASFVSYAGPGDDGRSHCFDFPPLEERATIYEKYVAKGKRARKGKPDSREVATIAQSASNGVLPADAVAEHWHVERNTAYRWIAIAREKGLLPPRSLAGG